MEDRNEAIRLHIIENSILEVIDLTAESWEALKQIDELLHDRWFDVDALRFDDVRHLIQVPFCDLSKGAGRTAGAKALVLEIRNVEQHLLNDTEGVGLYDFNKFVALRDTRTLRIETGVPLCFEIKVTGLDVRLFEM